ncbi:glucuronidase 2 [Actinidia rufa]|uniref:Glucuronidase 2 n=1 Tax=Actinidia rufa TaxID=165716 RepID=A0A7J0H1T7_9ERIC|nr:glucuronidase 2 [Actinidia rufa]
MRDGLFGFSKGCLHMKRWDEVNDFFKKTGVLLTFGLNALHGRHQIRRRVWGGDWDSSNANDFIKYTISKGHQIDSWEFGNELCGSGIGASVGAEQYGRDLIKLKSMINELYKNFNPKPILVAPGGFYDKQWYDKVLQVSGSLVVNAVTHHIYNLGAGVDRNLVNKILDPSHLSKVSETFSNLKQTIQTHGPWASAWIGESGGAYNSGRRNVSNTFVNSFCALLWHRLMGKEVLAVNTSASPYLRSYAHCSKGRAGITLLLINLSNHTRFDIGVQNSMNINLHAKETTHHSKKSFTHGLKRNMLWVGTKASDGTSFSEEYLLTPEDGDLQSKTMLLNGKPLQLTDDGDIPSLNPVLVDPNSLMTIAPLSIKFVAFPNFEASACK